MTYVYQDPVDRGYIPVPITRKKHNELFKLRRIKLGQKVEYYYHPGYKSLYIQYLTHWWAKAILITVMFIPSIFMQGVPETIKELKSAVYERKLGKFTTDQFWLNTQKPNKEISDYLKSQLGDSYDFD